MLAVLQSYSGRREYRLVSILLLIASILVPMLLAQHLGFKLLAFVVGLPFYAALVALTYYRLQNTSLSSGWVLLMVLLFHAGPKWQVGSLDLYPTGFVSLLPVIMGWFARDNPEGMSETN